MQEVMHLPAQQRFQYSSAGHTAVLDYHLADGVLDIRRTHVPQAIGGRGVAGQLVQAAFAYARAQGLKIRPTCTYVHTWLKRHPEQGDMLAQGL